MKQRLLYPGSFNPFHNGHLDIFNQMRSLANLEDAYVGVAVNSEKNKSDIDIPWTIRPVMMPYPENVVEIEGLTATFAKERGFTSVVRSMRNHIDFEYEKSMAAWNERIAGMQTIFLPCLTDQYLSSSALREVLSVGNKDVEHDVRDYVPHIVYERYKTKKPLGIIVTGPIGSGKTTVTHGMYQKTMFASSEIVYRLPELIGHNVCDEVMKVSANKERMPLNLFDLDKEIRQYVTSRQKDDLLKAFKAQDDELYGETLSDISDNVGDWGKMFPEGAIIEASALGAYMSMHLIPQELIARFLVIELNPSKEQIMSNLKKRYASDQMAEKIYDERYHFYERPPFVDFVVN